MTDSCPPNTYVYCPSDNFTIPIRGEVDVMTELAATGGDIGWIITVTITALLLIVVGGWVLWKGTMR